MKSIILASQNKGKIIELQDLISELDYKVLSLSDIKFLEDIEETGNTLHENAFIKANTIYQKTKKEVLADDSGLFVEALNGDPGIYSARYAGEHKSDSDNITKLLQQMKSEEKRGAYFGAVLCYIDDAGVPHYFEGRVYGEILFERKGEKGFGYDPIFKPSGHDKSFAELNNEEKNKFSHRGNAMKDFIKFIKARRN